MRRKMPRRRFGWLVAGASLAALLVSCGSAGSPSATASQSPEGTPSSTVAPSADETDAVETWDLVWFSDSSVAVSDLWAERIEERLGIMVRVHNFGYPNEPGGQTGPILEWIGTAEALEVLAEAEVIGLYTNPGTTEAGDKVGEECATSDATPRDPPEVTSVEDYEPYADRLRSIYDRIFELRAGQPTIVRALDLYTPTLDQWTAAGVETECTAAWEAWTSVARDVAAEYGVPMASMYDAFNGPQHDEDPVDKGYIGEDGEHPSAEGNAAQVEVLDALGYDPVEP